MNPILLYDSECGLCDRFVQYVLRRDRDGRFRFAALQGEVAGRILRRHGRDPSVLNSIVVVIDPETSAERLLIKSRAALYVLGLLGGFGWLARLLGLLPTALLDFGYDRIARNRYAILGKAESCRRPEAAERARFLDLDASPRPN